jgi:thioredoxin-like negative regulator of GroEL
MTLFERARQERDETQRAARDAFLKESVQWFERTLALDPENVTAHYGLAQVYALLGDARSEAEHRAAHARYQRDDNAADRVIAIARRANPAADHAAEAIVIYDLQRPGAYWWPSPELAAR